MAAIQQAMNQNQAALDRDGKYLTFALAQEQYGLEILKVREIIGVLAAVFITRSITRPINRIIMGLTEGSEQVAAASGQVSAASPSLAEGATEQATGLEETSSSLEEMSSMTKQNADNAEESASASEELSAQAESMQEIVGQSVAMVGGAGSQKTRSERANADTHRVHPHIEHKFHSTMKPKSSSRAFGKSDEALHKIVSRPEKSQRTAAKSANKSIPLDSSEEDLSEFND